MAHDPSTARPVAPDAPPTGDTLRLVRLRLYLTLAAAAILPMALGSPLLRILTGGPNGLEPIHVVALVAVGVLLVVLGRWMTHQILMPAAELEASRARLHLAYEEVREFALVDGLTGLGNHRSFQEEFESLLDQARRYGHEPVAGAPGSRRVQAGQRCPGSRRRRRAAGGGGEPPAAADPAGRPRLPGRRRRVRDPPSAHRRRRCRAAGTADPGLRAWPSDRRHRMRGPSRSRPAWRRTRRMRPTASSSSCTRMPPCTAASGPGGR